MFPLVPLAVAGVVVALAWGVSSSGPGRTYLVVALAGLTGSFALFGVRASILGSAAVVLSSIAAVYYSDPPVQGLLYSVQTRGAPRTLLAVLLQQQLGNKSGVARTCELTQEDVKLCVESARVRAPAAGAQQ
jgi:hypothetical protein